MAFVTLLLRRTAPPDPSYDRSINHVSFEVQGSPVAANIFSSVYWMAGLAPDAAHYFKFLFILVLYTFAMTLFVSLALFHCCSVLNYCRISCLPALSATVASLFSYLPSSTSLS